MVTKIISLLPQIRGNWSFQVSVSDSRTIMIIATAVDPSLEPSVFGQWPCKVKFFNAIGHQEEIKSFIDSFEPSE